MVVNFTFSPCLEELMSPHLIHSNEIKPAVNLARIQVFPSSWPWCSRGFQCAKTCECASKSCSWVDLLFFFVTHLYLGLLAVEERRAWVGLAISFVNIHSLAFPNEEEDGIVQRGLYCCWYRDKCAVSCNLPVSVMEWCLGMCWGHSDLSIFGFCFKVSLESCILQWVSR